MREINKILNKIIIGCVIMSLLSCKTASLVNFENENFEKFKNNTLSLQILPEEFYFSRILTAIRVDFVFRRFSKTNNFNEIIMQNITIQDDSGNIIYRNELPYLQVYDEVETLNECGYKIYYCEIPQEEFDRNILKNYKTKFIILSFEINGKQYSEKLKRVEKKYLITRT